MTPLLCPQCHLPLGLVSQDLTTLYLGAASITQRVRLRCRCGAVRGWNPTRPRKEKIEPDIDNVGEQMYATH